MTHGIPSGSSTNSTSKWEESVAQEPTSALMDGVSYFYEEFEKLYYAEKDTLVFEDPKHLKRIKETNKCINPMYCLINDTSQQ